MSNPTAQILRTGITPVWGLASGVAAKSKAVGILLTSANVSSTISEYEQLDSEGRKAGYLCYDNEQSISISGNIIYTGGTDVDDICDIFTVGAEVSDSDAVALLDAVRTTSLNGTETSATGTYVCKSFNVNQTNTDAVSFDCEITYYGFANDDAPGSQA